MKDKNIIDNLTKNPLMEETGSNRIIKIFSLAVFSIIIIFLIWASISQVEEISVAEGTIIPIDRIQKIQYLNGGIVQEILVKNGDLVKKGQLLIKVDSLKEESSYQESKSQADSYKARKDRISAILNNKSVDFTNLTQTDTGIIDNQSRYLNSIIMSANLERQMLISQRDQLKMELSELKDQHTSIKDQHKYLSEEIDIQEMLMAKKATPRIVVLRLLKERGAIQEKLLPMDNKILKTDIKIQELSLKIDMVNATLFKELLSEEENINHELPKLTQATSRYAIDVQRSNIVAPVTGYVNNLTEYTVGGLIEQNEVVLEIIPKDSTLVAKVNIKAKDIGHVSIGQTAFVKFTTYDSGRYGNIKGKIINIAPTSINDPTSKDFQSFEALISLDSRYIGYGDSKSEIKAGMIVTADIKTGQKSIIEYLLKPIFTSAKQALRER